MTVGGTNSSLYTGPINWIPINQPAAYWKIPLQAITIGGVDLGLNSSGVVMDTGTSLIGGPAAAVAAIYAAIPGSAPTTVEGVDGYYLCTLIHALNECHLYLFCFPRPLCVRR